MSDKHFPRPFVSKDFFAFFLPKAFFSYFFEKKQDKNLLSFEKESRQRKLMLGSKIAFVSFSSGSFLCFLSFSKERKSTADTLPHQDECRRQNPGIKECVIEKKRRYLRFKNFFPFQAEAFFAYFILSKWKLSLPTFFLERK